MKYLIKKKTLKCKVELRIKAWPNIRANNYQITAVLDSIHNPIMPQALENNPQGQTIQFKLWVESA